MPRSISTKLVEIEKMSNGERKLKFKQLFGTQPKTHNPTFLLGFCSYRLQELELGGLSQKARDQLRSVLPKHSFSPKTGAKYEWRGGKSKAQDLPPIGTELTSRCGKFRCHVAPGGQIEFRGERYPSVTRAAKAAVEKDTAINGRQFWGLSPLGRRKNKSEVPDDKKQRI